MGRGKLFKYLVLQIILLIIYYTEYFGAFPLWIALLPLIFVGGIIILTFLGMMVTSK